MTFLAEAPPHVPITAIVARLALSLVFGGAVGLDRQLHHKAAGLRTQMLVCLGACTFTTLAMVWRGPGGEAMSTADASRIIQGIVGGIGFLGAGVIIHAGTRTLGITTAAAIWTTAAVGVALGMGEYSLALAAGVLALLTLVVIGRVERGVFKEDTEEKPAPAASSPLSGEQPADRADRTTPR